MRAFIHIGCVSHQIHVPAGTVQFLRYTALRQHLQCGVRLPKIFTHGRYNKQDRL